jgi:epoxide hydrolase-like predicted phosphatase
MHKKIEALIFDIGGVLWVADGGDPLSTKWAPLCGLDAETFDSLVFASEWGEQALVGEITNKQLWENIGKSLDLRGSELKQLEQDYWGTGKWNTTLLDFIWALKKNYKLAVISDAESNARTMLSEWVNDQLFDVIVFSAEEGFRKPDARIYQNVLTKLGVEATAAVFVDDRAVNVVGAKQIGINAIQYEGYSKLLEDLSQYRITR